MKALALLLALALAACGPMLNGGTGSGATPRPFVVIVHNTASVSISIGIGSSSDGYAAVNSLVTIAPRGTGSFYLVPGAPDRLWLHNPLTWSVPGFYFYDQVYRQPTDYAANAQFVSLWYP